MGVCVRERKRESEKEKERERVYDLTSIQTKAPSPVCDVWGRVAGERAIKLRVYDRTCIETKANRHT